MITLIELYDVSRLPLIDEKGNRLRSDFVIKNADRVVKSVSVNNHFDIVVELEEEDYNDGIYGAI